MHKILIYLHIIYLLKSSTCFEHYPAHLQKVYVVIVYVQPLVSSISAGYCLVYRLRKKIIKYFYDPWSLHCSNVHDNGTKIHISILKLVFMHNRLYMFWPCGHFQGYKVPQCIISLRTVTWLAETYIFHCVYKLIVVCFCAFVVPLLYIQMVLKFLVPYNVCVLPRLVGALSDFHEGHCWIQ
jgi:hypothetical protein